MSDTALKSVQCVFIRNIMVGRKGLTRPLLLEAFKQAGGEDVASFLATGNLIFRAENVVAVAVTEAAAQFLSGAAGLNEPFFLRSLAELRALQSTWPFADAPTDAVHERCVTFLPLGTAISLDLPVISARRDMEIINVVGPQVFSVTRRIKASPGSPGAWLEKRSGLKATTRNWNTVERLIGKYGT